MLVSAPGRVRFHGNHRLHRALEELATDEPATLLRLALAHAHADRFDISSRILQRLASTGGRSGDPLLAPLGVHVAATQIARHLAAKDLPAADRDRLSRRGCAGGSEGG